MPKNPKEVFAETYQKLEQIITDLNMTAAEVEKDMPEESKFLNDLADDVFVVMRKVAGKVSGCAGCAGCGGCPMADVGDED